MAGCVPDFECHGKFAQRDVCDRGLQVQDELCMYFSASTRGQMNQMNN